MCQELFEMYCTYMNVKSAPIKKQELVILMAPERGDKDDREPGANSRNNKES